MTGIIYLIKILLCTASFILLCVAAMRINLNRTDRAKQFIMPGVALIYGILAMLFLNDIHMWIERGLNRLSRLIPYIGTLNLNRYIIYLVNTLMVFGFLLIKSIALPILNRTWGRHKTLMEATSGHFYEYDRELGKWFVQPRFGQVGAYYKGIYVTAVAISGIIFALSQYFPKSLFFQAAFYPVFGILIVGEVVNFLAGFTRREFMEDILGEDEESYRIVNYGLLRDILKNLFGDHVLYDATVDNGLGVAPTFETLEDLCESGDPSVSNLGRYFRTVKESGKDVNPSYVKSCIQLVQGDSVLFCDPFYRDLTQYILIPMLGHLMRNRKCLIIIGRDSSTNDVKRWLDESMVENINTDSLWKTEILSTESSETDIGILRFSNLFNMEIWKHNADFLSKVGFVFLIEPSKLLATGQIGLSLLVSRLGSGRKLVFAACDRNCDGLVDALSHTLKTTITEVAATSQSATITSMMCWDADGEYMHHRIISNVSRYLGIGTEINSVAMKYQISNTLWVSGEKIPVTDIKWVAGQYYNKICNYANLPASQESFNKSFQVNANLWDTKVFENTFLVVEDEFRNLFEMIRLFSTRAMEQGFINVISENYLLRDYMFQNAHTFISDPKAIPTIVADYARTERNTVLKLLIRMTGEQVSEEDIADALMVSGIGFDSPVDTLKELVRKHCNVDEINLRVYFKEVLLEDGFLTETKKFYSIEEESEIAEFTRGLRNAYYIAEDEKGEKYYIGAKLYGHIFQSLIPGQFLTHEGKYYEVESITPLNGVVVRRAADHIVGRKYYRQIRHITLRDWKDDSNVGGQKTIGDIRLIRGYCQVQVHTEGYLEMRSYNDLRTARYMHVSGIPDRSYRNKLVTKIMLPGTSARIRYTTCLLLNEIFRTTYPDACPYITVVTQFHDEAGVPDHLKYAMYTMESEIKDDGIYVVEDSEIDLGLTASVERNLERFLQIAAEVLIWHDFKMNEKLEKQEPEKEFKPEFMPEEERPENQKKKNIFARIRDWIKSGLHRKRGEGKSVLKDVSPGLKDKAEEADIAGDEEERIVPTEEKTYYQEHCFLKYGYEEIDDFLDLAGTASYLADLGYDYNPLRQVRDNEKAAEEYAKAYDPGKSGAHFCDFCGVELAGGEYDVLKDGRERCNYCSSTALRTVEQFREIFKVVMRNMEIFFGIKISAAIKVRMTDANTIAKHFGEAFVPTPGPDGRVIGFARRDASGYSLYIENGAPKLTAMATIAHELTHIWQYQNWNDKEIKETYGEQNRLEVYEGMAKWVEIQYLLYLNEIAYGKREQIRTSLRQDEYGRGFVQYLKKYPLSYHQERKLTPFREFPPL